MAGPPDEHKLPAGLAAELNEEPRVLVVEDDPLVQRAYGNTLQSAGFRAVMANNIAAAREVVADQAEHFDAAVLDFELPDGTALDLVGPLLQRTPLCKSLIVTGVAGPLEAQQFVQLGAHAFISKPLRPEALVAGIISTVYATLQWRRQTNQLLESKGGDTVDLSITEAPPPLGLVPGVVLARLRHIGGLSPVQTLVAYRLMWGDTDREIAAFLDCAERTVKRHVSSILRRTGAKARSGLLGVLLRDSGYQDDSPAPP